MDCAAVIKWHFYGKTWRCMLHALCGDMRLCGCIWEYKTAGRVSEGCKRKEAQRDSAMACHSSVSRAIFSLQKKIYRQNTIEEMGTIEDYQWEWTAELRYLKMNTWEHIFLSLRSMLIPLKRVCALLHDCILMENFDETVLLHFPAIKQKSWWPYIGYIALWECCPGTVREHYCGRSCSKWSNTAGKTAKQCG